ncbi:MAG TPA: hypothetical protein VEQ11_17895 [Chloroflexota bacterium]|nr:hypothetical protein [Chloroflexota bacterium]
MRVAQGLLERVIAFVEGRISLPEFQLWLAERVQRIADESDPHAAQWSDRAWILVGEWLDGLRDEPGVRAELKEFLGRQAPPRARPALTPNQ